MQALERLAAMAVSASTSADASTSRAGSSVSRTMMFDDDEPAREVEAPAEVEAAIAADLSRACISPGVSLSSSTADDVKAQESPGMSPSWTSSCSSGGTSKPGCLVLDHGHRE